MRGVAVRGCGGGRTREKTAAAAASKFSENRRSRRRRRRHCRCCRWCTTRRFLPAKRKIKMEIVINTGKK